MTLIFNPAKEGLLKVFKDYQKEAMKFVWEVGEQGTISREVWDTVNERLVGRTVSRASITTFLNAMVDKGVLDYHEESGKGGYHRIYRPKLDEFSFKRYVAQTVISSLMNDYPEETKKVLKSIR